MADIFISYAREDRTRIRPLADALSAHGWSVWWDRQIQAGKAFDEVIADALASARCVVVVWSHQSIASSWVREEAEEGRRREILIPVLIDGARPPLGFGRIQAVELGDWTGGETSDAFQNLIEGITAIIGPPQTQASTTAASFIDEAPPSAIERRVPGVVEPHVVSISKDRDVAAPAGRGGDGSRGLGDVDASGKSVRRYVAWAAVLGILALGLYRLRTAVDGGSQPRPTTAPSAESALQLRAVLTEGGKPLPDGVQYEIYEAAKDADGKRKRVTSGPAYQGPPRFPLAPGRYYVTATYGKASAGTEVGVAAAEITRQTLNLRAGILRLACILAAGGNPLANGVQYDVYEAAKDPDGNRKRVASSGTFEGPPRFPLPAGRYYVTATYGSAFAGKEVGVSAGDEPTRHMLELGAGILSLTSVLTAGGNPLPTGVQYEVYEAAKDPDGKRKRVTYSPPHEGPPRLPLPAGRYYVTATYGSASAGVEVGVAAGDELTRQMLDLQAGILGVTSVMSAGGNPLPKGVQYDVYEAAKDPDGKRKRVASSGPFEGPRRFPLPAGRYYVTATYGSASAGMEVGVSAGDEPTRQTLNLRAGILALASTLSAGGDTLPKGVQYDVYDAAMDPDGKRKLVTSSPTHEAAPRLPLPAGRYYVTATYGSATSGTEVGVTAGDEPTRQMLDLRAGVLSLSAVLSAGGNPLPTGVEYEVYEAAKHADGNRKLVTSSPAHGAPPRFPLPVGRYYVAASSKDGKGSSEVTILPGGVRQLELRLSR